MYFLLLIFFSIVSARPSHLTWVIFAWAVVKIGRITNFLPRESWGINCLV